MAETRRARTGTRRPRRKALKKAAVRPNVFETGPARAQRAARAIATLVRLMNTLRSPRGCPWDREQTHDTLKPFLLEESYEALDALDRRDFADLCGELGDVLFQCVFHAQIAAEAGRFELADAIGAINAKLIRRHPHVFTSSGQPLRAGPARQRKTGVAATPKAVLEQWEQLKAREQQSAGRETRVLAGIPRAMPALLRAHEIGTRVAAVGFDWPDAAGVAAKLDEEIHELNDAMTRSVAAAADELGDVLFSAANLARKLGLEPEAVLRAANDKFTRRFDGVEAHFEAEGRSVHQASPQELEAAWTKVKASHASPSTSTSASSSSAPSARRRRSPS